MQAARFLFQSEHFELGRPKNSGSATAVGSRPAPKIGYGPRRLNVREILAELARIHGPAG
jgi:hypothetical protein